MNAVPSSSSPIPSLRAEWLQADQRLPDAAAPAAAARLGVVGYGQPAPGAPRSTFTPIQAQLLAGSAAAGVAWQGQGAIESGRAGQVRWQRDAQWLFGAIDLDEAASGADLATLAQRAYGDLFETLRQHGRPHLLRVWNYLPHINAEAGGLERYRQFNQGRQQAFLDAGQAAFEGSPAACALGTRSGPLSVRFLAGLQPALPVENPRQVSAYRYPSTYGPRAPTFSRAALIDAGHDTVLLSISGTASIVGHSSVHVGDVAEQTRETLRNLQAVTAAAQQRSGAGFGLDALDAVVYLRRADDAPTVRRVLREVLGEDTPFLRRAAWVGADICRSELLVEIEAHGIARGRLQPASGSH